MTPVAILLAVKPRYVSEIFAGRKGWEFRRRIPALKVQRVAIYESSPTRMIVGEFGVGRVLDDTPEKLWTQTSDAAGIDHEGFAAYFAGTARGFALEILRPRRYLTAVDPRGIQPDFLPPTSFAYFGCFSLEIERAIEQASRQLDGAQ